MTELKVTIHDPRSHLCGADDASVKGHGYIFESC